MQLMMGHPVIGCCVFVKSMHNFCYEYLLSCPNTRGQRFRDHVCFDSRVHNMSCATLPHASSSWSKLRILTLNGRGTEVSPLLYTTGGGSFSSSGSNRKFCRRRARKRNISALESVHQSRSGSQFVFRHFNLQIKMQIGPQIRTAIPHFEHHKIED